MKVNKIFLGLLVASLGVARLSIAQTPLDGLMMPKGEICLAIVYENANWDRYWEGSTIRTNGNIGTFTRQTAMPMLVGGISDKLNFILSLPYVKTAATGGQLAGLDGIQDLGLSLKAKVVDQALGKGKALLFSNLSFSAPVSNYLADYLPFSIGFGAKELGIRAIGQYELDKGTYLRASFAYLHRGLAQAERDYYYNNQAVYSDQMDVPDAYQAQVALGSWFLSKKLRVEASLTRFRCATGDDIRIYAMPQPTNKVDFDRLEGFAQYYFKNNGGFGVIASYNHLFSGRNMGQFSGYGLGITYQFKAL